MPYKAHVRDNPMADGIDVALIDRPGGGITRALVFDRQPDVIWTDAEPPRPDDTTPNVWTTIPDDAARALYETLAAHYGHAPGDNRLLRRDYEAERARVDALTIAMTQIATAVRS